mmetsp:Transcript_36752/g.119522  ORF Transcript_36752/g.119522 Transcript_36752/m.119522 type:complete len:462 (-) Transcript_36752:226-1611(-)
MSGSAATRGPAAAGALSLLPLLLLLASSSSAASAPATLCDANSTFACSLLEYLQPPTAAELEAKFRRDRASLKRSVQSRVFGVRVGWDRAHHFVKDWASMGIGGVAVFRGGALPKPGLLLQGASLSSGAATALVREGEAARAALSTALALAVVHVPGASVALPLAALGHQISNTLADVLDKPLLQALPGGNASRLLVRVGLGVGGAAALALAAPAAGLLPFGVPAPLAATSVVGAFVLVEALKSHLAAEWWHMLDAAASTVLFRLLPAAKAAVRAVVRLLWRPVRAVLRAAAAAGSLLLRAVVAPVVRAVAAPAMRFGRRGLALLLRALSLLLSGLRAVMRALRAPLQFLFPRAAAAAGRAARAAAKTLWRHGRTLRRALGRIKSVRHVVAGAGRALKEHWPAVVPWMVASAGVALQLGHISAGQVLPYLSTALNPSKLLALAAKALAQAARAAIGAAIGK